MKKNNYVYYVLFVAITIAACSKGNLDEQGKDEENTETPETPEGSVEVFAPKDFKSGDKLYELYPNGSVKNYCDIFGNNKIKYGTATVASNYSYSRLTNNTALFSYIIQQNTDLNNESYIRWWKYNGILTWKSKTEYKGTFVCEFTSTKFPSKTTNEIINFRYVANVNNVPGDSDEGDDNNLAREFIQEQIIMFEQKKAEAEKQLNVYLSWDSSAMTVALINTQRELIDTYEQMIQKWKAKLNNH